MEEPSKHQIGDGQDQLGQAAGQAAKAARQFSAQSAAAGNAASNASAAAVQAGTEGGKAVAAVTTGTAAAGPWGAVISAAWAMRHTLFKILVCVCLLLTVFIVLIVSLPSIVTNGVFGLNGIPPGEDATLESSYARMSDAVSGAIDAGYGQSLERVEAIIADGGYDYDLSMDALVNYAQGSAGYDVCYILAAYSASLQQQGTSEDDMVAKLYGVSGRMFPVAYEVMEQEHTLPLTYTTYKAVTVTVVSRVEIAGIVNGIPRYTFITEDRTYYLPDGTAQSEEPVTVPNYHTVEVSIPVYTDGEITGTRRETYYIADGQVTLQPGVEIIEYVSCTIHPFDNTVIADAFGIDLSAAYPQFDLTYGQIISKMADALQRTLYGSLGSGTAVPLTDAELIAYVNTLTCNETRKHILSTALSLVGKVPYFWGGKSDAGWNDEWNRPRLVTSAGSSSTGTIRPFGLDCSGFTDWVFKTALGVSIHTGSTNQMAHSIPITEAELLPGDLGFLMKSDGSGCEHVLMFAGYDEAGNRRWVHSESGTGVHINTPRYESRLVLRRPSNVDFNQAVGSSAYGEPLYSLEVNVTHYCACAKCCGSDAQGITASGKQVAEGMVAMSSHYPFGTQIMINGIMYTVEDRGSSAIENDIGRVDIYVPDHNQALRMGRYDTIAYIYRTGR